MGSMAGCVWGVWLAVYGEYGWLCMGSMAGCLWGVWLAVYGEYGWLCMGSTVGAVSIVAAKSIVASSFAAILGPLK